MGDVQDCQGVSASEMTYIVSGGALNSTHSLQCVLAVVSAVAREETASPACCSSGLYYQYCWLTGLSRLKVLAVNLNRLSD